MNDERVEKVLGFDIKVLTNSVEDYQVKLWNRRVNDG